jgi:hypothetical protein
MLQARRSRVQVPMRIFEFSFNLPNPSSRIMALRSTQPLTEMSTRNRPGIIYKMWELRRLTTLWAFTACYRNILPFTFTFKVSKNSIPSTATFCSPVCGNKNGHAHGHTNMGQD